MKRLLATISAVFALALVGKASAAPLTANVWIDTNGGTCVLHTAAVDYASGDSTSCSSFQAAYNKLTNSANVARVHSGARGTNVSLSAQTLTGSKTDGWVNIGQDYNGGTVTVGGTTLSGSIYATLSGLKLSTSNYFSNPHKVSIINSQFTGPTEIVASQGNLSLTLDHNTFDGVGHATHEGRISVAGDSGSTPSGVTISNNHIGNGGCSDGIQLVVNVNRVKILNNEFSGIVQGNCNEHADPIQFYGAVAPVVTGNFFHDNSTGIMAPDGAGSPMTVTHNVFESTGEYDDQIVVGGGDHDVINHNTMANGARIRIGAINVGPSVGETAKDNVIEGGFYFSEGQSTSGFTIMPNLLSTPTYAGGAHPTTYAGFKLAAGSAGKGTASDGSDMGI